MRRARRGRSGAGRGEVSQGPVKRGQCGIDAGTRGLLSGQGGSAPCRCPPPWLRHSWGCRRRGPPQGPSPRASSKAVGRRGPRLRGWLSLSPPHRPREGRTLRRCTRGSLRPSPPPWGSRRSTTAYPYPQTRPAPPPTAQTSAPPHAFYRLHRAGPSVRLLPPAAKECLTLFNPAGARRGVPPPPSPQQRGPGTGPCRLLREDTVTQALETCPPPHRRAGLEDNRGLRPSPLAVASKTCCVSLYLLSWPSQAHLSVRTTLRGHQERREGQRWP